jgi:hypothetical protein
MALIRTGVGALVREGAPVLKVVHEENETSKHAPAAVGGSLLLLRHGIVYADGVAWTGLHQVWLRRQHFDSLGLRTA